MKVDDVKCVGAFSPAEVVMVITSRNINQITKRCEYEYKCL